jgi:hypothetical protein
MLVALVGGPAPVQDVEDDRFPSDAGLSTPSFPGPGFRVGSRREPTNDPPAGIETHDRLLTLNPTCAIGG